MEEWESRSESKSSGRSICEMRLQANTRIRKKESVSETEDSFEINAKKTHSQTDSHTLASECFYANWLLFSSVKFPIGDFHFTPSPLSRVHNNNEKVKDLNLFSFVFFIWIVNVILSYLSAALSHASGVSTINRIVH